MSKPNSQHCWWEAHGFLRHYSEWAITPSIFSGPHKRLAEHLFCRDEICLGHSNTALLISFYHSGKHFWQHPSAWWFLTFQWGRKVQLLEYLSRFVAAGCFAWDDVIEPDATASGWLNSRCWQVDNAVEVLLESKANSASASRVVKSRLCPRCYATTSISYTCMWSLL